MKTRVQLMACVTIMLSLSASTTLSASGQHSGEREKKENAQNSGWIGIMIQDVNSKIARKAKLESEEGAYVKEVVDDSPADSAGIQEGDIIIVFNEKKLSDSNDLVKIVRRTLPGTKAEVVLVREGIKKTLYVTVGRKKVSHHRWFPAMPPIPDVHVSIGNHILGMQLLTLNEQLGEYFGVPNNEGVLVEEVERKSAAEDAGLKAGDIIIRVGTKAVDEVEKVQRELRKYDEGDKVEFEVLRKGAKKTFSVEMEEGQNSPQNFFFQKPHFQIFKTDPLEDTEMNLDDLQPSFDQIHRELRKVQEGHRFMPNATPNPLERFGVPHQKSVFL
jgi:membrane-associated protease RseP (regulator of RpoE activity)